jgi:DNA-binding SARP family transcriptional activator
MAGPAFRFGVLGPLRCQQEGRVVALPRARQHALFALLLESGGAPIRRDRRIDKLWSGWAPASAAGAPHLPVSKLRVQVVDPIGVGTAGDVSAADSYRLGAPHLDHLATLVRAEPELGA